MENGVYSFIVPVCSKKNDIKVEVEKLFGVKVTDVRTVVRPKKNKTFRGNSGEIGGYKKAYVKVANGLKIDFENIVKN